jgi:HD-GYP domain-containing protein (c-di-GMP phosphodiesterase class II)
MTVTFAKKNYGIENEILLPDKDQKTPDNNIEIHVNHGILARKPKFNFDSRQYASTSQVALALGKRMKIGGERLLEYPSQVLSAIIADCETKPWRMFSNMLGSYVGWLYTHSIDVAIISLMMPLELNYDHEELFDSRMGAFLHDVGKLLSSRSIIGKPRH